MNNDNIAIVREAERSAYEWHKYGESAIKSKNRSILHIAEAWYYLKESEGWKEIDSTCQSFYEYVFKYYDYGKQTADKFIRIFDTFVLEHGLDREDLSGIGWGKLSIVVAHVCEQNLSEILGDLRNLSQADLKKKYVTPAKEVDPEEYVKYNLNLAADESTREMFDSCIEAAKEEYSEETGIPIDKVSSTKAFETMAAHYMTSVPIEDISHLRAALDRFERIFEVTIEIIDNKLSDQQLKGCDENIEELE